MTSPFFPGSYGSPFDDFFARYLSGEQRVPRQRVDITQFLSQQARELVNTAARQAVGSGSADLDTEHLLWAMTGDESTRTFLSRTGLDPDRLRPGLARPGLHLHRARAPAVRAGAQPGLTRRPDPARAGRHPRGAAAGGGRRRRARWRPS